MQKIENPFTERMAAMGRSTFQSPDSSKLGNDSLMSPSAAMKLTGTPEMSKRDRFKRMFTKTGEQSFSSSKYLLMDKFG